MADKPSSDHPAPIPKKPPKRPTRDYSNLPQRPITLKQIGKKKSVKKKLKRTTKSKPTTAGQKKPSDRWLLKGISESTRQYAQEEAERQGLTLEAWIEQLILSHQQSVVGEQIAESLFAIEQRLDRMEEQRGFWHRFWEQVMSQSKT